MRIISHNPANCFFDHGFNRPAHKSHQQGTEHVFPVRMDIAEDDNSFKILAELPGLNKDDIKITVKENLLTINGERARNDEEHDRTIWSDRYFGSFTRSFKLPDTINKSGVSADYKNGLLNITLPKKEETRPQAIDINVN